MEKDKRPFYISMMVLFINIFTLALLLFYSISDRGTSSTFGSLFGVWNFIMLGISIFVSVVPMLISRSNSTFKNRFGYGIPILLILPLPYFVYDYFTCTGKFCEIGPYILGLVFSLSAVVFAVIYTICIFSKKWNSKLVLFISFLIPILIFGGLALLGDF